VEAGFLFAYRRGSPAVLAPKLGNLIVSTIDAKPLRPTEMNWLEELDDVAGGWIAAGGSEFRYDAGGTIEPTRRFDLHPGR
jgi:hypothetical protein